MSRPAKGSIQEHRTKRGEITRTLRFRVNGHAERVALGVVSLADGEDALRHTMADVEGGTSSGAGPRPGATWSCARPLTATCG
jgi:hypothetical protein